MEELIASLVSLVVLIPIIYFLPMGLTKKGKGIVILIAFILANLGILASANFTLWQTGLILLLLTVLTVYILDKRLKKLLFLTKTSSELPEYELEESEVANLRNKPKETTDESISDIVLEKVAPPLKQNEGHQQDEQMDMELLTFEKTTTEEFKEEEISVLEGFREVAATMEDISELDELDLIEVGSKHTVTDDLIDAPELTAKKEQQLEDDLVTEDKLEGIEDDEEISFLANRDIWFEEKDSFNDSSIPSSVNEEGEYTGYMSEIEELLEGEHFEENNLFETTENNPSEDEKELTIETVEESLEADTSDPYLESHPQLLEDNELPVLEFTDMGKETRTETDSDSSDEEDAEELDKESDLEILTFEDNLKVDEKENNIADQEVVEYDDPWLLVEDIGDEANNKTLDEHIPVPVTMELEEDPQAEQLSKVDTEEHTSRQEKKTALQQQLFQTMVSQLHLARGQMQPMEYEELVIQHLHPELPAQDFYTFVSLLIEHYISQKEIGKLQGLLINLDGKFENYPILDMEIHFLYKQYCENVR